MPTSLDQLSQRIAGSTPALLEWIHTQWMAGYSVQQLQQSLQTAGWQPTIAHAAIDAVAQTWPIGAPLTQSPQAGGHTCATAADTRYPPQPDLTRWPSEIDVGDRRVQVLMSMEKPHIVLLGNLLSHAECDAIVAAARPALERSRTVATRTSGEEINPDRTSYGMFFQRGQTPEVARLEARIARLMHWPVDHGEGLQVLHYTQGAQYRPHHDFFQPDDPSSTAILRRGGQRLATLVIYLNDVMAGGSTFFPAVHLRVQPRKGHAVFFGYPQADASSLTLHGGDPVLEGEKWIATKWLRERTFQ